MKCIYTQIKGKIPTKIYLKIKYINFFEPFRIK